MHSWVWGVVLAVAAAALVTACAGLGGYGVGAPKSYEVWIPDQGYDKVIIYTATEGDGEVRISKSGEIILAPPGPQPTVAPHILLFGPGYKRAYVAGVRAGGMFVVDAEQRKVVTRIPTGRTAHAATPSWDGSRIWVANVGDNNLVEVVAQGDTYTKGRTIPTDPRPSCAFWSRDDSTFWVVTGGPANAPPDQAGTVTVVDAKGGHVTKVIQPIGRDGCAVVPSYDERWLYASSPTQFTVADAKTGQIVRKIQPSGKDGHGFMPTPDGKYILLAVRQGDSVDVLDARTHERLRTVPVGSRPDLFDLSPSGRYAFVSRRGKPVTGDPHVVAGSESGFAVLDTQTWRVVAKVRAEGENSDIHGIATRPSGFWNWMRARR
ncbi:MAG: YncE family protein [Candidatus Tectomicrobia bacterium]|uniref:YncE family protein n=1 Tax=Tectimicrobiota bacterium TaxID=2528274 RepID=A0A932GQW9_UNCTE|nr:YncE family protein [Candidatus Tectomicrobia bacterium]